MDFDDRPSIVREALVILAELLSDGDKHFDCYQIAEAFKKKFLDLDSLDLNGMSHRIGICLSSTYKKDPTSISRIRNEKKNKRKGGSYLYGVPTTTENE